MNEVFTYFYYFKKQRKAKKGQKLYDENNEILKEFRDRHLLIIIDYTDVYNSTKNYYNEFVIDFYNSKSFTNQKNDIKDLELDNKIYKEYNKEKNQSDFKIYNNINDYKGDYIDDFNTIYSQYQIDEKNKLFFIPKIKYDEIKDGVNKYKNNKIDVLEVVLNKLPNDLTYINDFNETNINVNKSLFCTFNQIKDLLKDI